MIVKVMYNDKLLYKVVVWVFFLDKFMKREGSFKIQMLSVLTTLLCTVKEAVCWLQSQAMCGVRDHVTPHWSPNLRILAATTTCHKWWHFIEKSVLQERHKLCLQQLYFVYRRWCRNVDSFNALVNVNSQGPPPHPWAYPGDSDIWENVLSESPLWVKSSVS